jgi:hypothetical protein
MQIRTCVANGEDVIGFRAPEKLRKVLPEWRKGKAREKKDTFP